MTEDFESALKLYKMVLKLHATTKSPVAWEVAETLSQIGFLYFSNKDYEQAKTVFKRALPIYVDQGGAVACDGL